MIDGSVVNVGLPAIAHDLKGSGADLQWVVNAYLLPLSAILLLGGALGDRFGRRRVLIFGVTLFALSASAAGAPWLAQLSGCCSWREPSKASARPCCCPTAWPFSATPSPARRGAGLSASGRPPGADRRRPRSGDRRRPHRHGRLARHLLSSNDLPLAAGRPVAGARAMWTARDDEVNPGAARPGRLRGLPTVPRRPDLGADHRVEPWRHRSARTSGRTGVGGVVLFARLSSPSRPRRGSKRAMAAAVDVHVAELVVGSQRPCSLPRSTQRPRRDCSSCCPIVLIRAGGYSATRRRLGDPAACRSLLGLASPVTGALAGRIGSRLPLTLGSLVITAGGLLLALRIGDKADFLDAGLPA